MPSLYEQNNHMPLARNLSLFGIAAALCLAIFLHHNESFPSYGWSSESISDPPPSVTTGQPSPRTTVLGIELGRFESRVGIFRNNTLEIFADEQNRTAIPAYVAFTGWGSPLSGFAAKEQAARNPKNTIYDLISIVGRKMAEPRLHDDIRSLPYEIAERNNTPLIKVRGLWNEKLYTLEHVYSFVFQDLKRLAEVRLNQSVQDVVVAVPTYFDDARREAIKNAAAMAGLDVIRVTRESRAAAMAYDYGMHTLDYDDPCNQHDGCKMVVYHQGEAESYAVVMDYDRSVFEVLEVVRETEVHPNGNSKAEMTSISDKTEESPPDVQNAVQKPLTAPTELEHPALKILDALLKKAKVGKQTVEVIFITGNPSQVTLVEPKISAYFTDKRVISRPDIHPDEAIIRGVCKEADVLAAPDDEWDIDPVIDITYLGLGIETAHGAFTTMIPRFSVLPTRKRKLFSTVRDNQEKVVINVFEGDRAIASKNRLLGVLELAVPLRPRGEPDIEIEFEMTPSFDVVVWARELRSGREAKIIVPGTRISIYTQEELDLLAEEAEERKEEDLRWLENARIEMEHAKEAMSFGVQLKD